YVGNIHDVERQSTFCPACKICLIERDWYELGIYQIVGGACASCQTPIPGVFENSKGSWGRKRMPLRIVQGRPASL
ncbi:MAG TPA: hypothetical protein V6C72_17050, partial [Chroococcales cyanobacterium]